MESAQSIRSHYLAYVPFIGCCFEKSSKDVIEKIGEKNLSSESIKSGYQFIASHIHSGDVKKALKSKIDKAQSEEEIKVFLDPLIDCIIEEGVQHLRHLELFDFEQVKTQLQEKKKDFFEDALELAQLLPKDFIINQSSVKMTASIFTSFFTNFLNLFHLAIRLDTEGRYMSIFDTNSLLDIYWKYLMIPVFMASKLADWLLNWSLALVIVVVLHVILGVIFFIYNKFFKMAPSSLPRGMNLNRGLQNGDINPVCTNPFLLKDLNNMLKKGSSPVLTGDAGAGKSSLSIAFAQQQTELNQEGMQVYIIKTTDLVGSYDGMPDQLNYMDRILEGYKGGKAVIFFEEFDTAMAKGGQNLWKSLFSLRERHKEVICIPVMTTENYLKTAAKEPEFDWRFENLSVEGKETALEVIRHYHRLYWGNIHVTEEAMKLLNTGEQQPARGIAMLRSACQKVVSKDFMGTSAKELEKEEKELFKMRAVLNDRTTTNRQSIKDKQEKIEKLKKEFKGDLKKWEEVQLLAQRYFELNNLVKTLVQDLESGRIKKHTDRDRAVKAYAFIEYCLKEKIEDRLEKFVKVPERQVLRAAKEEDRKKYVSDVRFKHYVPTCVDLYLVEKVQEMMLKKFN